MVDEGAMEKGLSNNFTFFLKVFFPLIPHSHLLSGNATCSGPIRDCSSMGLSLSSLQWNKCNATNENKRCKV